MTDNSYIKDIEDSINQLNKENSNPNTPYPNLSKYFDKDDTLRWIDIEPIKFDCDFCGAFYSTVCVVCDKQECNPKPNIKINIEKNNSDKTIHAIQTCYDIAVENKTFEQIQSIIQVLNKYSINYKITYDYDFNSNDLDYFPTYDNLQSQLLQAIKNLDLEKVVKLRNLDVLPTEKFLSELIRINSKYSFESTYEIAAKISNIIIKDFYQIDKKLVLKCITTANNHLIKLFIDRCKLDEDIYFYSAMLGYLSIIQELDKKSCPKNYMALIAVGTNELLSFGRRIKVLRYLITNGLNSLPKRIFDEPNIFDNEKIANWIKRNCTFY